MLIILSIFVLITLVVGIIGLKVKDYDKMILCTRGVLISLLVMNITVITGILTEMGR